MISAPTSWQARSKSTFSSCPVAALIAGVKIGSGSLSHCFSPGGRATPQTVSVC